MLTSNLKVTGDRYGDPLQRDGRVRKSLQGFFRPEFVNRLTEVIVFSALDDASCLQIIEERLRDLNAKLEERGIRLILGKDLTMHLVAAGLSGEYGGRAINRAFQSCVVDPTTDRLLEQQDDAPFSGAWLLERSENGAAKWTRDHAPELYLPAASS